MFVAGGTGGHINPAIAVAKEMKRLDPSAEVLFVGTEGRMETKIVPKAGFEIKTVKQYPKNYNDVVNAAKEEKAQNHKPKLVENCDVSVYDTIFIGTPVWWYTFSSPIRTFLSENDFSDKTIMPFCTHGGGGASSTYSDIQKLCPNAIVKDGYTSYENSAKIEEIKNWINM